MSININIQMAERIAQIVKNKGGAAYYVGGFVRDRILGNENKDIDIEVHGISPSELEDILDELGERIAIGESFGIYGLKGYSLDIAMPRKENAIGKGHRDFDIFVDPYIGTKNAALRRDFTINALMEDVLSHEILDYFGGSDDLRNGIIRHINDESFVEDPLRVLRAAQFASRFGFDVADTTIELCKTINLSSLSRERIEGEMKKALLKSQKPSIFFNVLREMEQLDVWFPELKELIGLEQDPIYHPEGDVWVHTMEVIDRAALYRDEVSDAFAFMLLALTHDFGKITTTEFVKGRIHAYRHETEGLPIIETFLKRITNEKSVLRYVKNMVPLHMKPNVVAYNKSSLKSTNRMFDEAVAPKDLIYFAIADKPVMVGDVSFEGNFDFLKERYSIYEELMARPYVTGKDLIEAGLEPSKSFKEALEYAHKLRIAGIEKDSALKQTLGHIKANK